MFNWLKRIKLRKDLEFITEEVLLKRGFVHSVVHQYHMFKIEKGKEVLYRRVWSVKNYYKLVNSSKNEK